MRRFCIFFAVLFLPIVLACGGGIEFDVCYRNDSTGDRIFRAFNEKELQIDERVIAGEGGTAEATLFVDDPSVVVFKIFDPSQPQTAEDECTAPVTAGDKWVVQRNTLGVLTCNRVTASTATFALSAVSRLLRLVDEWDLLDTKSVNFFLELFRMNGDGV